MSEFDISGTLATIMCLKQRIAELEFQLANALKNSSTSSKPLSSDIVKHPKPPAPEGGAKRRRGGQPDHPRHECTPFSPEIVDEVHEHRPGVCPECGCAELVSSALGPRIAQQVEPVAKPLVVTEHRAHAATCPKCEKVVRAPLPEGVERGRLLGPRLTARVAWMKGAGHSPTAPCSATWATSWGWRCRGACSPEGMKTHSA